MFLSFSQTSVEAEVWICLGLSLATVFFVAAAGFSISRAVKRQ